MLNILRANVRELVFRSDLKATRLTLALGAIFIGLGFAWPVAVFPTAAQISAGNGRHTYALMAPLDGVLAEIHCTTF